MLLLNFPIASVLIVALLILLGLAGIFILLKFKNQPESCVPQSNCYENSYRPLSDAIIILNDEKRFVHINPAAEEMLGCKLRSMMGRGYQDAFDFKYLESGDFLPQFIGRDSEKTCECLLETVMNQSFSIDLKYSPISRYENDEENSGYLLVLRDITQQKLNESYLSNLKKYDSLTGMLNAKSFEIEVKHLIDNSGKYNSKHILVYFSIDQFQDINDSIGYTGADSLIITLAGVIKKHVKRLDIVGKVGGGEFAVVFRDDALPSAIRAIEATLKAVEGCNFTALGHLYPTTFSAGFVVIDGVTTSSARVITEASIACSVARKRGGNRLYAYKSDNSEIKRLEGGLEWIVTLKKAIQEDLFQMYAQPIHLLNVSEYEKPFCHYELLIRLFDKSGNLIAPDEFLSAAEYYSMMPQIDRWVVRNVLGQISKIPNQHPLPVFAINLSGQSLNDSHFLDYVIKEVESSGVNPQMLCFEITEQVAVDDVSIVNQFISSLKSLGSEFSLDDFGTGISGFSYLRALDVDYLKIDGSFVKNIDSDEISRSMVQSISQVGHTMNLKVIAEYVENQNILNILREMGVDYGQGYYIQRPGPLLEVAGHHMKIRNEK